VILPTGAELRITGRGAPAVVCVNGGQASSMPGTWSATIEWLVARLALRFPELRFAEVRYRTKSWRHLDECIDDARAAIAATAAPRTLLLGFSMGGGVSVACAAEPSVEGVLGLAPWIPEQLSVEPLRGRRLRVMHGSLDRALPGVPGVSPELARRGFDRARSLGVDGEFTVIRGAVHGVALRSPWGSLVPLPRAGRWLELVADEVARFGRNGGAARVSEER
jgi:pimeloyl-ACP methyl ester carboxylesterase